MSNRRFTEEFKSEAVKQVTGRVTVILAIVKPPTLELLLQPLLEPENFQSG